MFPTVARQSRLRADQAAQIAFHQRDAGVFDGDVGAGAHGDARRPRQPVPEHR